MTVADGNVKNVYTQAVGGTVVNWDYTFPIVETTDIHVYLTDLDGAVTEVTSNFSVDTTDEKVVYPTAESLLDPIPAGYKITLIRERPYAQEVSLSTQGAISSQVHEGAWDDIVLLVQQLKEALDRCVKYPLDRLVSDGDVVDYIADLDALVALATAAKTAAEAAQTAAESAQTAAEAAQTGAEAAEVTAVAAAAMWGAYSIQQGASYFRIIHTASGDVMFEATR